MADSTYSIYEDDGMNDDKPLPSIDCQSGDLVGDDQLQADATAISQSPSAPTAHDTASGTAPRSVEVYPVAHTSETGTGGDWTEKKEAAPEIQGAGMKGGEANASHVHMGGDKSMMFSSDTVQTAAASEASASLPSKVSSAPPLLSPPFAASKVTELA